MKTNSSFIYQLATESAENAVNNLSDHDKHAYTGYGEDEPGMYSICGLRDQIIETYYDEYSDSKPTPELFEELADAMVI